MNTTIGKMTNIQLGRLKNLSGIHFKNDSKLASGLKNIGSFTKNVLGNKAGNTKFNFHKVSQKIGDYFKNIPNSIGSGSEKMTGLGLTGMANTMTGSNGTIDSQTMKEILGKDIAKNSNSVKSQITDPSNETIGATPSTKKSRDAGWKIVNSAIKWSGKHFKKNVSMRCTDFVSTVIDESATKPPGYKHTLLAYELAGMGKHVSKENLQPGDIVIFKNTWRKAPYTHAAVYLGNGKIIHRADRTKPVHVVDLNCPKYKNKFSTGRRMIV